MQYFPVDVIPFEKGISVIFGIIFIFHPSYLFLSILLYIHTYMYDDESFVKYREGKHTINRRILFLPKFPASILCSIRFKTISRIYIYTIITKIHKYLVERSAAFFVSLFWNRGRNHSRIESILLTYNKNIKRCI